MKDLILLFSCDEWRSRSSFSLVMGSVSLAKIRKEVKRQIKVGDMSFDGEVTKRMPVEDMNRALDYGYIIITKDGERQ